MRNNTVAQISTMLKRKPAFSGIISCRWQSSYRSWLL